MMVTKHPTGQDLKCLVCGTDKDIDIDHVVNRGMGGSKARDVPENKVPLCRECHTAKTNNILETATLINPMPMGGLWYLWRRAGANASWISVPVEVSQRYKCLVGMFTDGAEAVGLNPAPPPDPSASSLSHDQRVAIAAQIKEMEWNRQFYAGDTALAWRQAIGEEAEQYLSDFGYVELSLANIMRVCEKIPPAFRHGDLRFSHHVVVTDLNREDMEMWLDKCVEESWSVAEFRRQVKGTKPKVKRYSLEELRGLFGEWHEKEECEDCHSVDDFFRWLGEQG